MCEVGKADNIQALKTRDESERFCITRIHYSLSMWERSREGGHHPQPGEVPSAERERCGPRYQSCWKISLGQNCVCGCHCRPTALPWLPEILARTYVGNGLELQHIWGSARHLVVLLEHEKMGGPKELRAQRPPSTCLPASPCRPWSGSFSRPPRFWWCTGFLHIPSPPAAPEQNHLAAVQIWLLTGGVPTTQVAVLSPFVSVSSLLVCGTRAWGAGTFASLLCGSSRWSKSVSCVFTRLINKAFPLPCMREADD